MGALRTMTLADSEISALVGTRVFVNRIPESVIEAEDTYEPSQMLVLSMAGGAGKDDWTPLTSYTINVLCYGQTQAAADEVLRAVFDRFTYMDRETFDDVLFHHINPTGGPLPLVDPDIVWPAVVQSYSIMADAKE